MTTHPDVLIVGGGVIGLMTGWMLARAGVTVTVIDSGMPAATNAAAGMLAPSFEKSLHKTGDDLAAFSAQSLSRWPDVAEMLRERSGIDCDFQRGVLSAAFDETEAAAFEKDHDGGERLTRDDVLRLEPAMAPSVLGGRYAKDDGQIDPRLVRTALTRALLLDGGRILRGKSVAEIRAGEKGAVNARLFDGETLAAARIVIAAGARVAGLADLPKGAAFPVKGEALAIKRRACGPNRVVRTSRAYFCPKADGRIVIGATEVPGDWSLNADDARVEALKTGAAFAFPALKDAVEAERWAGLRPATKDGAPIIGPAPETQGVIFALGHYRNGILLAPATAAAIVRLVVEGRLDPSIAAFSAARFNQLGVS